MSENFDFETDWLNKFHKNITRFSDEETAQKVTEGAEGLNSKSNPEDIISWTQHALDRLERFVDDSEVRKILLESACHYPQSELEEFKQLYAETRDVDLVHRKLQEKFERFLSNVLKLDEKMIAEVERRGWGVAGFKKGNTIIVAKIPKSGYLKQYLDEKDPEKRREIYCHCPRIRDAVKLGKSIPSNYCYCSAGFYKNIWETILQKPVEIEMLKSIFLGDDECQFKITLPVDA
ncbi:MAG: DUF6144 family protein [Candidatus Celaenobacter antarcticus]|nr:DUF6144 family protein [Candidatus Celaenobacter antarcticus]